MYVEHLPSKKVKKIYIFEITEHYKINHIPDHMYGVEANPPQYSCLADSMGQILVGHAYNAELDTIMTDA